MLTNQIKSAHEQRKGATLNTVTNQQHQRTHARTIQFAPLPAQLLVEKKTRVYYRQFNLK